MEFFALYLTGLNYNGEWQLLKSLTYKFWGNSKMEAKQENNGDKNLLRNDLGDNRGTKIKREIPQLLTFNGLWDFFSARSGTRTRMAAMAKGF